MIKDDETPYRWKSLTDVMGGDPFAVLACFSDLGLSDAEIARYFRIDHEDLMWLRSRLPDPLPK